MENIWKNSTLSLVYLSDSKQEICFYLNFSFENVLFPVAMACETSNHAGLA